MKYYCTKCESTIDANEWHKRFGDIDIGDSHNCCIFCPNCCTDEQLQKWKETLYEKKLEILKLKDDVNKLYDSLKNKDAQETLKIQTQIMILKDRVISIWGYDDKRRDYDTIISMYQ